MTFDKMDTKHLTLNSDLSSESSQDNEQALVETLERYLRRSSLARAYSLPRWVMW